MPAQNIYVLRNIEAPGLGAWFALPVPSEAKFNTPERTFAREELKRFE